RGILAALLRCLRGPPRLRPQLRGEQELALAMAQCALDDSERVHMRILQTIYRQLTRSRLGCPRYGAHWEELGFQGRTGSTPLPGGIPKIRPNLPWNLPVPSQLPQALPLSFFNAGIVVVFQNFPFCIMSVNITRIVIQALQEERLSRECNRRQQVIGVLNDLYAAAFLRLSRLWEQQHGTVANAGSFLKELELSTKKKPRQLLKSLEAYLSR
ncbi:ELMD3 protein, partial [Quiscalus mexicanus]|nr:ELMD3 protein [Quiscalus mexicanus]